MPSVDQYWNGLISTCLRYFQENGNNDAVFVIKNSKFIVKPNNLNASKIKGNLPYIPEDM